MMKGLGTKTPRVAPKAADVSLDPDLAGMPCFLCAILKHLMSNDMEGAGTAAAVCVVIMAALLAVRWMTQARLGGEPCNVRLYEKYNPARPLASCPVQPPVAMHNPLTCPAGQRPVWSSFTRDPAPTRAPSSGCNPACPWCHGQDPCPLSRNLCQQYGQAHKACTWGRPRGAHAGAWAWATRAPRPAPRAIDPPDTPARVPWWRGHIRQQHNHE